MMSHSELKSLSQEELRKRLYQTFKNKGVLDSLKTQLRNQLIQDLKHRALSGDQLQASDVSGDSLLHRACNSLVADHMRRCGYEYSLSVFYPECGLEKEKVFTVNDLMQLMKINPKSRLYNSLTSSLQNSKAKGFLLQILKELIDYYLDKDGRDADTQTVTTSPYKDSIVDKLKFIDEQFEEMYPKRSKFESLEGKLSEYRREIAEQLQLELSHKLQHFKDVEIAKVKLEEREKSQREISDIRRELEKTYQVKCDGLVSREKNAVDRLQIQQEIESKEIYAQRQTLLKEIEVVRSRERDLRQHVEAFELSQKLQEEKNKSVNELLRKRELEVTNIEDTYEQKLKNELLRYQNELNEEYLKKTQKVNEDERKNKEEAARLREDTFVINMRKQELEQAVSRTKQLETKVDTLKAQLSLVTQQNHHLTEKLKETVDYPLVKEKELELKAQVKLLNHQLEELQRENQLLREKASLPFPELLSLQEQLKKMESARKFDQDEFKIQREILEKQLELEIERGLDIKVQLLNREESSKRLSAQIEQMEFQLRQTQQALENEVYRVPRTSLLSHSVLDFPTNKIVRPNTFFERTGFKSQHLMDSIVETGGISGQKPRYAERTGSSSPDSDLEFVASTKARIKELEKEAEYLEEAYRNYQHRVLQTASIDRYPQTVIPSSRGYLGTKPAMLQHKVSFLEDNLTPQQHILLNRLKTQTYEGLLPSEVNITPPQTKISSTRRLSSTPVPKPAESHRDNDGSYISSSHHSPNHRLSPIPKVQQLPMLSRDVPDTGEEPGIGHLPSAHQPAAASLDITDHSKPEKIHPEGLNHSDSSLQDQEDIPEQLESDWSHPSEDYVHDIRVTADAPGATNSLPDLFSSQDKTDNPSHDKNVQRNKQINHQEPAEDPNKEHSESLKNADCQQEVVVAESKTSAEDQEENRRGSNPEEVNPLDKYMQLLLQKGAEDQSDKVTKEPMEEVSIEEKLFNESITAHSPGEADEDFW